MPKGVMVVESGPADAEREKEFNHWYDTVHLPELLAVPGFVAGRRYRLFTPPGATPAPGHRYLAIYEIEADELTAPLTLMRQARTEAGAQVAADLVSRNPPPVVRIYELLED